MPTEYAISERGDPLRVGDRIRGEENDARGAVGAIVCSSLSDELFAVTSAVVTGTTPNSLIVSEGSGSVVGRVHCLNASLSAMEMSPAWKLLGLFRIEAPVLVDPGELDLGDAVVEDPVGSLGMSVFRPNGQMHRGVVTAADMSVHLRAPGSIATTGYSGLVEVTADPGSAFADGSAGGQAVYLENGALLGLIIGGADGRCFVAPIAGLIGEFNFVIADELAARRHNGLVRSPASPVEREVGGAARLPDSSVEFGAFNDFMRAISNVPLFYRSSRQAV